MRLATSQTIRDMDAYAVTELGIALDGLIERSGYAVARVLRDKLPKGSEIVVLVGPGNNGADGYAAALLLRADYRVRVYDALGCGAKSEGARRARAAYEATGARVLSVDKDTAHILRSCDALIDAVFGTGYRGTLPSALFALSDAWNRSKAWRVAVDLPLGVDADTGEASEGAWQADVTVALAMPKVAHMTYPARAFVGEVVTDPIGLPIEQLADRFPTFYRAMDEAEISAMLPARPTCSNKGTFGHAMLLVGSARYRGAARLALEAALRMGVGYVSCLCEPSLTDVLLTSLPEVLYRLTPAWDTLTDAAIADILSATERASAVLVGSGCGCSAGLYRLLMALLSMKGAPLILDADALNALATYGDARCLAGAERPLILTPHPLELSRLCGHPVPYIEAHRLPLAQQLARTWGCTLILKGAATVVTDGEHTYLNTTGSTALAKAGSGDVLAGALTALAAYTDPLRAAALTTCLHGLAADTLTLELSAFGVLPSELPRAMAHTIARLSKTRACE